MRRSRRYRHGVSPATDPGPIALVGSGEYLPQMEAVDAELLRGRAPRAVFLATAAGQEGDASVDRWLALGRTHFQRLGVEPVPLPVVTRADAERDDLAALVAGAGLVYLSGGDPGYLVGALTGTAVWAAIERAWRAGTALAGCSAGAMALGGVTPLPFGGGAVPGLGVVPQLAVLPHFDRLRGWRPTAAADLRAAVPAGVRVVGVDEDTALVHLDGRWQVRGRLQVWEVGPDGAAVAGHGAGTVLPGW